MMYPPPGLGGGLMTAGSGGGTCDRCTDTPNPAATDTPCVPPGGVNPVPPGTGGSGASTCGSGGCGKSSGSGGGMSAGSGDGLGAIWQPAVQSAGSGGGSGCPCEQSGGALPGGPNPSGGAARYAQTFFPGGGAGGDIMRYVQLAGGRPCMPPPGGPVPPIVPGPGSPFKNYVLLVGDHFEHVSNVWIKCRESGATINADCAYENNIFYFDSSFTSGQTVAFSTPGGAGTNCTSGLGNSYASGSAPGSVNSPSPVTMHVPNG